MLTFGPKLKQVKPFQHFFFFKLCIGDNWVPLYVQVLYKVAETMSKKKERIIFYAHNELEIVTRAEKLKTHFELAAVRSRNLGYSS